MRKFTINERRNGEMAVRKLSETAQELFNGTDPINVYEYEVDSDVRYAYDGCLGNDDNLTLAELQETFESLWDAVQKCE